MQDKIVVHSFLDVVEDVGYDADSSTILKEIISMYDADIASTLAKSKVAKIPYIGNVRKNRVREEFLKLHKDLHNLRKVTNKEEYKDKVKEIYRNLYKQVNREDRIKVLFRKNKASNRAKYERLCATAGKPYANMFIYSICLMAPVEFDPDVEAAYQMLFKLEDET
jgi:hypothetical protein